MDAETVDKYIAVHSRDHKLTSGGKAAPQAEVHLSHLHGRVGDCAEYCRHSNAACISPACGQSERQSHAELLSTHFWDELQEEVVQHPAAAKASFFLQVGLHSFSGGNPAAALARLQVPSTSFLHVAPVDCISLQLLHLLQCLSNRHVH